MDIYTWLADGRLALVTERRLLAPAMRAPRCPSSRTRAARLGGQTSGSPWTRSWYGMCSESAREEMPRHTRQGPRDHDPRSLPCVSRPPSRPGATSSTAARLAEPRNSICQGAPSFELAPSLGPNVGRSLGDPPSIGLVRPAQWASARLREQRRRAPAASTTHSASRVAPVEPAPVHDGSCTPVANGDPWGIDAGVGVKSAK